MNKISQTSLSIITVTKNDQKGLEKTYRSLEAQVLNSIDLKRIEWIIIDGGSSDNTLNFIEAIRPQVSIDYITEIDKGIFDAMNKGVNLVKNTHVIFINAGDILSSDNTLAIILRVISKFPDKINAGNVRMKWGDFSQTSDLYPWVCHQAVVVKTSILKKYPFDVDKKYYGDLELWMRLKEAGIFNVNRINDTICDFYMGGVGNRPEDLWHRMIERNKLDIIFNNNSILLIRVIYTSVFYLIWRLTGRDIYYRSLWYLSKILKRN
jgi:putative colanic acid biosynthesis glycosyltransferase